jgi:hypothetical protein
MVMFAYTYRIIKIIGKLKRGKVVALPSCIKQEGKVDKSLS